MGVSRADADREVWAHAMAGKVKSKALSAGFNSDTPLVLSDLPHDLATALAGFDADGNGHVTVGELAEGARLLHSTQEKVRPAARAKSARRSPPHCRELSAGACLSLHQTCETGLSHGQRGSGGWVARSAGDSRVRDSSLTSPPPALLALWGLLFHSTMPTWRGLSPVHQLALASTLVSESLPCRPSGFAAASSPWASWCSL